MKDKIEALVEEAECKHICRDCVRSLAAAVARETLELAVETVRYWGECEECGSASTLIDVAREIRSLLPKEDAGD